MEMQKNYSPQDFEDRLYKQWQENGYFTPQSGGDKKPFTILMPPPNITGQLHMGHALNNAIQDTIIRFKRMQGFSALYLPGTDHASIATEVKIVEAMEKEGLNKKALGRDAFLQRAWKWKDDYGDIIIGQLKKLGCSCDWTRLAFTMDERCSRAVRRVFVKLYGKGLIYQSNRIINWCPTCGTALSDAEVEYAEEESFLWYIDYPLSDNSGTITVATTRPETMLGDTAVAVNPNDKRYRSFIGKTVKLPLTDREIPIVADSYVDPAYGTGAVKITPAHDPNDFEVGKRHNLKTIRVIADNGTMNQLCPPQYQGLDRKAARTKIVDDLKKLGLLSKTQPLIHSVGHCYRCDDTVEPLISLQWFVKMQSLAQPAIDAVKSGEIEFIPKRFDKVYFNWMENIKDWCISRQLWWGHRIPAYYCKDCGQTVVSEDEVTSCPGCGGKVTQDEDVLDTWFSSALWPFSTLGWPDNTPDLNYFYPTNVLVTGYDIIFFWVARMIFSGIENMGQKPFDHVLLNGLVRDAKGRKMSKSLNNGIDPLDIIEKYGADTLRFSLLSGTAPGGDMRFSEDKMEGCRNFINKLWNASRFVLMNTNGKDFLPLDKCILTTADKWILTKLNKTTKQVTDNMEKYELGIAGAKLYDFVWSDFCDWYIELSKIVLYGDNDTARHSTLSVLCHVLTDILKLLHPFIPFITEEIYQNIPGSAPTIMLQSYPVPHKKHNFPQAAANMQTVMELIKSIRNLRAEMNVPPQRRAAVKIVPLAASADVFEKLRLYIEKFAYATEVEILAREDISGKNAVIVLFSCEVYISLEELIDKELELKRLNDELSSAMFELKLAEGKLNNPGFTQKAPPALVSAEQEKLKKYSGLVDSIKDKIGQLG